ncbi:putative metal-sulfur cluster biosynthesis protein YuaD [Maritalea myrionectae]|uniref:Putative metal-sulfur cluster biosynthesis protein YuaD n=1 Tax=Maritalea myrionectae TaxID=454601 RepID=A0A2R4MD22_9HYPH|nr:MOSC domain-containing protein [Maritalea myrionectae]AVX03938.1 putative metal-sulfur cluster biosynthesis protein YuaD [Maritalea myrionectae]
MTKLPAQKFTAEIADLFLAAGDDFISASVPELELSFEGIVGDHHAGLTRKSGGREPWYKRGTEMRNERQVSLLSVEEVAIIAERLDVEQIDAGRIGANMLVQGLPQFSQVPPRTQIFFPSGAVLRIDGYNAPCKIAGAALQADYEAREDIELGFVKAAEELRGLVAWVERPGIVRQGDEIKVRVWPQQLYNQRV